MRLEDHASAYLFHAYRASKGRYFDLVCVDVETLVALTPEAAREFYRSAWHPPFAENGYMWRPSAPGRAYWEEIVIIRNSAKCKLCGDEIISKHRHDFVECSCGEIFVDGGTDYIRRGAKDVNNLIETSLFKKEIKNVE
jgi:hypothetical protein